MDRADRSLVRPSAGDNLTDPKRESIGSVGSTYKQAEASPYARHLPALDGIRGLAVIAVMCSHLFPGSASNVVTRFIQNLLFFGATGVDLFFILSGFLITGILFDSLGDTGYFRKFYARRVLRIFPLYYGALVFYALAAIIFGLSFHGELASLALYVQNTHLIAQRVSDYIGPSNLPLTHFWSLAVEEQFYLVWPFVVFGLRRRHRLLLICLLFTMLCPLMRAWLWLHGWSYHAVHENTLFRADALLAGAGLALLLRGPTHDRVLRMAASAFTFGAILTAFFFVVSPLIGKSEPWWPFVSLSLRYTALDLLYTGLIAFALAPGWAQTLFRIGPLRSLGKYSYGLYVLHLILFAYLDHPLRSVIAAHLTRNKAVGIALTGTLTFVASLVCAMISYRYYEKPFLQLKRYFTYKEEPAPAAAATEAVLTSKAA